jgi:hypothetical protein
MARMLHQPASLPFAFPATYLLLSKYMLLMGFVSYLLALSDLLCLTLVVNVFGWSNASCLSSSRNLLLMILTTSCPNECM